MSNRGDVRHVSGRVCGKWENHNGYFLVRLNAPRIVARVHRLVAEAFLENPSGKPFVNHKDCDRKNNAADNLEWCTQWENLNHSHQLGRMQRDYWKGKRSPNASISDELVTQIRSDYAKGGISWEALGNKFGISKRSIGRIVNGESYVGLA